MLEESWTSLELLRRPVVIRDKAISAKQKVVLPNAVDSGNPDCVSKTNSRGT